MKQIAQDICMLENVGSAPAFLLGTPDDFTLIDTGTPGKTKNLTAQLEEHRYALSGLRTIVLTHCHADHTGGVADLVKRSGAKVAAHQEEIPYVKQEQVLPANSWLKHAMLWVFDRVFSTHITQVDIVLHDGDTIDILGGLKVIHVPGHTPGSIALYQPERRIMFFGDVIFNEKSGLRIAPNIFNTDTEQTKEAARKLASYSIDIACFGHGEPMTEHAGDNIRKVIK
jgi:glyoxylase-like metal-dependent hydrolase (beta-lactamase superfamily II)